MDRSRLIEAAKARACDWGHEEELEVDDVAETMVSYTDEGAWVQAWIWVDYEEVV